MCLLSQYLQRIYKNDHPNHTIALVTIMNYLSASLVLILCLALVGTSPSEDVDHDVALKIQGDTELMSRDPNHFLMLVDAELTNNGDLPIKMVLPGDGSVVGWRTPLIKWSVEKIDDVQNVQHEFHFRSGPRCGNINRVRAEEIVSLKKSETVSFEEGWISYPLIPCAAGKYAIKMSYENIPDLKWAGMGYHQNYIMRKIRATDYIKIESNEIIVEVE